VVDSTGAGDAFIGGFLSGMMTAYPDAECMALGSAVAAAKLGKKGARQGLPEAAEVNERIRTLLLRADR
jgi:ribokinase